MEKLRALTQPRPEKPRFDSPPSRLALIDFHHHQRGGHFGPWLRWFAEEFAARFDDVDIVTPRPESTRELFRTAAGDFDEQISFLRLPVRMQRKFHLEQLIEGLYGKRSNAAAFIMWGYDLCECRTLSLQGHPWATLFGISRYYREGAGRAFEKERMLLDLVEKNVSCRAFFQPDQYLNGRRPKSVWVTDLEDMECTEMRTPLLDSMSTFAEGTLCIGVFGMLHGNRCVDEVLALAREHPDVRFVLAGKIFVEGVRTDLRPDLEPGARENLLVWPSFIESNGELNAAIRAVNGLFIDGRRYPVQSGIVCRGLHFGKWILSSAGDSWTTDVIHDGAVGLAYRDRSEDFVGHWMSWKDSGGEERSRAYSRRLRDPETVASCFDRMASRLRGEDILGE